MRLRDYEFTGIHSQIGETTGEVIEGIVLPLTVNSALIYDLKAIAIPHCGDSEFIHGVLFQHLQGYTTPLITLLAAKLMPLGDVDDFFLLRCNSAVSQLHRIQNAHSSPFQRSECLLRLSR